jgi:hypothetical protein
MHVDEYLKDFTEEEKKVFWDSYYSSDQIYKEFMAQYKIDHACCPNCGETSHGSTLVGFAFNSEYPDAYRDLNNAMCKCGYKHTIHERVPKK